MRSFVILKNDSCLTRFIILKRKRVLIRGGIFSVLLGRFKKSTFMGFQRRLVNTKTNNNFTTNVGNSFTNTFIKKNRAHKIKSLKTFLYKIRQGGLNTESTTSLYFITENNSTTSTDYLNFLYLYTTSSVSRYSNNNFATVF